MSYSNNIPPKSSQCLVGSFFFPWNSNLKWVGEDVFKDSLSVHGYASSRTYQELSSCRTLISLSTVGLDHHLAYSTIYVVDPYSHICIYGICTYFPFLHFHFTVLTSWPWAVAIWMAIETFSTCFWMSAPNSPEWSLGAEILFLILCQSFFVWWCLQNNDYFCSWTMINLRRYLCRL